MRKTENWFSDLASDYSHFFAHSFIEGPYSENSLQKLSVIPVFPDVEKKILKMKILELNYRFSDSNSTITSISTAMLLGSDPTPTADLACLPFSPKTSTIRSENPLMTAG